MVRKARPIEERLWAKTDRSSADGCWPWLGGCDKGGYGSIKTRSGQTLRAHRVAWTVAYGDPGDLHVLHRCDNKPCVRPDHLFLGTHQDNIADLVAKRRASEGQSTNPAERGTMRVNKGAVELSAYAGFDPAAGRAQRIYDRLPLAASELEIKRRRTALVAKADKMIDARKDRKANPYAADPVASADPHRTVADALEAWWSAHGVHLEGGQERGLMDRHLIPTLGAVELWRLRPAVDPDLAAADDLVDLTDFFTELRPLKKETFRPDTVRLIRNVLRGALAREVGTGGLESNPAVGVKLPRGEDRESTTPEPAQAAAFFAFLAAPHTQAAQTVTRRVARSTETVTYELPERTVEHDADAAVRSYAGLVMAGPRPQEVSALRRGNYDVDTGRLRLLAEGIVWVKKKGQPGEWVHRRGETVKRRKRTIVLPGDLRADLKVMMAAQDEMAAACGAVLDRRSYLFTHDPDGSGWMNPQVAGRSFSKAVDRALAAGIDIPEEMRLYDMRHFGITRLVRARRDIPTIAKRYATSAEMIYRVYAHGSDDDDLADDLGGWG